MADPLTFADDLRAAVKLYMRTAFGTRFEQVNRALADLVDREGVFQRMPHVEVRPLYASGKTLEQLSQDSLPNLSARQAKLFADFAQCGLFDGRHPLYAHQETMLRCALRDGRCVITSGTGSGKTEAFLLPLVARLIAEGSTWAPVPPTSRIPAGWDWWNGNGLRRNRRNLRGEGTAHRPAVRAMLLYPMNALVDDQMNRLRAALDSDAARAFLDENLGGNRLYFGRLNGATPVAGHPVKQSRDSRWVSNSEKQTKLRQQLTELQSTSDQLVGNIATAAATYQDAVTRYGGGSPQARAAKRKLNWWCELQRFFPRVLPDSSELVYRWEMMETPPDILVTNQSMLQIMLSRSRDLQARTQQYPDLAEDMILEATSAWLRHDTNDPRFHLVIDELHTYRGSAGTEVAYLIRSLLDRLGLSPDDDRLVFLASSASLRQEDPESRKFLRDFLGSTHRTFHIIPGDEIRHTGTNGRALPPAPFTAFAERGLASLPTDFVQEFGPQSRDLAGALEVLLAEPYRLDRLLIQANETSEGIRPVAADRVATSLFGAGANMVALRGLFKLLAEAQIRLDELPESLQAALRTLPSLRLHLLVRNFQGLFAPGDPDHQPADPPIGTITHNPSSVLDSNGRRLLELGYCEQCGEIFLFGRRSNVTESDGAGGRLTTAWQLTISEPELEKVPFQTESAWPEFRSHADYGVFWPDNNDGWPRNVPPWTQRPREDTGTPTPARWAPALLRSRGGAVRFDSDPSRVLDAHQEGDIKGWLYVLDSELSDGGNGNQSDPAEYPSLPQVCPNCHEDYEVKKRFSPIRTFRSGLGQMRMLLAKHLLYSIEEDVYSMLRANVF